jgi:acetyl-CoA carboxylase carboxyl transferase subunit beta
VPTPPHIPNSFICRRLPQSSLGLKQGDAVLPTRYYYVTSLEVTRWIAQAWGIAAFVDAGNAFDDRSQARPAVGYGIGARVRIGQLVDEGSFEEMFTGIEPADPLKFVDRKAYKERLKSEQSKTGEPDAVICGKGFIKGRPIMMAVMDCEFMMGSMGSVVGEKITRTIEAAIEEKLPLLIVSASGGARMQESTLSLMQMAKTSAAVGKLDEAGGLFISLLTDPTTGGVTASFAMLGDFIIAEPKALIGFAGPRTIWNTIKVELPEGFQRSEFLEEHGFVDFIVHRRDLRSEIARLVDFCAK